MTKCPYVPPHPWNVDFPHLMLRAKAIKFRKGEAKLRDKLLSSTDAMGKLATIPVVVQVVNAVNRTRGRARGSWTEGAGRAQGPRAARVCQRKISRHRAGPTHSFPVAGRQEHARQGRDLLDLLRQLQRARHRARPAGSARAQRDSRRSRREGSLLRHAQARTGRPRGGGAKLKEINIPVLARLAREGYAILTRGAVLHADVQAGTAADVSRTTPT